MAQQEPLAQPGQLARPDYKGRLGQPDPMEQLALKAPLDQEQLGPLEPKELPAFKAPLGQQQLQRMQHNFKVSTFRQQRQQTRSF